MPNPKLNALLIGVNKYEYLPENAHLNGCEGDAQKMYEYLEKASEGRFDFYPKVLLSENARRKDIIDTFRSHLTANSSEDDVCVFYFSGHGGQEVASSANIFVRSESDGLLEGIVAYDSGDGGEQQIADKELRYLIHELAQTKCEIITIFDCCHSGDNTRLPNKDLKPKQLGTKLEPRQWEEFLFAKEIDEPNEWLADDLDQILPQGKHIHFSACMAAERAYESRSKKSGFFTTALLKALSQAKGKINYVELQRRILQDLRVNRIPQKPEISTPRGFQKELFKRFLLGVTDEQAILGNIMYDERRKEGSRERIGWRMDLGNLHGVEMDQIILVDVGQGEIEKAWVEKTYLNYSLIQFMNPASVDMKKTYSGRISGLMSHPLYILPHPKSELEGIELFEQEISSLNVNLEMKNIFFIKDKENIINPKAIFYHLFAHNNHYLLTREGSDIPLMEEIKGYSTDAVKKVIANLEQMSQWHFIKYLQNPQTDIPKNPLQLTMYKDGEEHLLKSSEDDPILLGTEEDWDGKKPLKFRLKFENNSGQDLYAACLYMDILFGVEVNFLKPTVAPLTRQANIIWAFGGSRIEISLDDHVKKWNLPYEEVRLKLIISREPFDVNVFYKPKMNASTGPMRELLDAKGLKISTESLDFSDWCTQDFVFHIKSP